MLNPPNPEITSESQAFSHEMISHGNMSLNESSSLIPSNSSIANEEQAKYCKQVEEAAM
jgi:hypothetical protein